MSNLMQKCIELQPTSILSVLDHRETTIKPFVETFKDKKLEKIFLIGSGSSYHAANMARPYMEEVLQMPVYACTPTQQYFMGHADADKSLLIAISQSGRSTNTFSAVNALKQKGYFSIGLTDCKESPLGRVSDLHIELNEGKELASQKTMGVVASILTLQMMAVELGFAKGTTPKEERESFYATAYKIAQDMPENITCAKRWYLDNLSSLKELEYLFLCGQYGSAAIAGEGALKLVETIYRPCFAYDFEEFLHGPTALFSNRTQMAFLVAPWDDKQRTQGLMNLCEYAGGIAYAVALGEDAHAERRTITLKSAQKPCFAPYEMLIPLQILSAYLSEEMGNDIDQSRFPNVYSDLGSKVIE